MSDQKRIYQERRMRESLSLIDGGRRQSIKIKRVWILFLTAGLFWIPAGCGKKAPPFLPQKTFGAKVIHLQAEFQAGHLILKGEIQGLKGDTEILGQVSGCRVYYAQYPLIQPPCPGCPIEFNNQQKFGPEIASQNVFSCKLPDMQTGQIYFLKVLLIGPDGSLGPVSERIRIEIP